MIVLIIILIIIAALFITSIIHNAENTTDSINKKDNKQLNEIKQDILKDIQKRIENGELKIEILMELRAECEGILNSSARQHKQFEQMPDGIAKTIEAEVIEQFREIVEYTKLRKFIIQELIDQEINNSTLSIRNNDPISENKYY